MAAVATRALQVKPQSWPDVGDAGGMDFFGVCRQRLNGGDGISCYLIGQQSDSER